MPRCWVLGTWPTIRLLEIAADMGVPIATLVAVAWIVIFAMLVRGRSVRSRGLLVPAAALAVAMLAVLHSLIDFSLQIPGYAIVALSLIGAGLAQSSGAARGQESQARSQEPGARSQEEPGARSQEPGARSQEPGARSHRSQGARSQGSQEPG